MAISFGFAVPLEPGWYAEVDGSLAGAQIGAKSKVLCLGLRLPSGTVPKDTLTFVPSTAAARGYFGAGSQIARIIEILRLAYPGAEVWAIAQDPEGAGAAATGTITVTGTATASGTIHMYIAGQYVPVGVTLGDTQNVIASAIHAAISAQTDLPVTSASPVANAVTLTARHKGLCGNDIDLRVNYYGAAGGEVLPAGVSIAITPMAGGTTEPVLTNTIAAMSENEFDTIINPYSSTSTSLLALKTEMADRWGPLEQLYGHVVSAKRASFADLQTYGTGTAQNDPHTTILGYYDSPTPPWEVAAALGALTAQYQMDADNATLSQGFTGLQLYGFKPPASGSEFTISERNVLLSKGIATFTVQAGACYLSRARTTYRVDPAGSPDAAFYDQRTLAILQRILRSDKAAFLRAFQGAVLVDDATRVGGGLKVCSPAIARGWFAARYAAYERDGLVTDAEGFIEDLVIEIHAGDPNRLDILYPPQLSGWLAVTAAKVQFRLV